MATRYANIKGVKFDDGHLGGDKGGTATIFFDGNSVAFTGGSDTIVLGGAGWVDGVANTSTLAVILANYRRDGKTVTLYHAFPGPVPGYQAAATNGPDIYLQGTISVSAGNVIGATLESARTGGSNVTAAASAWERPASMCVDYQLS